MAAYVIACIPLAIVFGFLMRYYVQGLTSGAREVVGAVNCDAYLLRWEG